MPDLFKHNLREKAILWPAVDEFTSTGARKVSSTYSQVYVRWEETQKEVLGEDGQVIRLDVEVTIASAVAIGGIFWYGAKSDLPTTVTDVTDLFQVVWRESIPTLRKTRTQYTLGLVKYRDKLPVTS